MVPSMDRGRRAFAAGLAGAAVAMAASALLHGIDDRIPFLPLAIAQVLVYLAWNYPMNRYFVFHRRKPAAASATTTA